MQEERKAIRDVVAEFNESWAEELGYQIQLLGWEDTVAGFGRPQQIINQEVDRCDLFVGMMWKRWGTPPDSTGKFTSGFQEEFERSVARRNESGSPEISLFFKAVSRDLQADPGDELKKVLNFRDTIISDRSLLFQEFDTLADIERLVRKCITSFVNRIRSQDESSLVAQVEAKTLPHDSQQVHDEKSETVSPHLHEGYEFLRNLIDSIAQAGNTDHLSSSDVARLRLLANSLSKVGNHETEVGAHDVNIIFSEYYKGLKLSETEVQCLLRLGFRHLNDENVPLWSWFARLRTDEFNPALFSSAFASSDNERVAAIGVLTSLSHELARHEASAEWIRDAWFSPDTATRVRFAALTYLAKHGTTYVYSIAQEEYERNDRGTNLKALEAMVEIRLRAGEGIAAQQLVFESQFESLHSETLQTVLQQLDDVPTEKLMIGLDHHNAQVRLHTIRVLARREALDYEIANRLLDDHDAFVRKEAIVALDAMGRASTLDEVKKVLVRPEKQAARGLLGTVSASGVDKEGETAFESYSLEKSRELSNAELNRRVEDSILLDDKEYFVRAETYFARYGDLLRSEVDGTFGEYFDERIRRREVSLGNNAFSQDLVRQSREIEDFVRQKLTRRGLDILCRKRKKGDVDRIRSNLKSGYAGASIEDLEFMGTYGCDDDVVLLSSLNAPYSGRGLLPFEPPGDFHDGIARALLKITRKSPVGDLFSMPISESILKRTITLCSEARFSRISEEALKMLLNHESADVRKAASVMVVRAFPKFRVKGILKDYMRGEKFRYYNVMHWLDLGVSMSRKDVRVIARLPSW